MSKTIYTIALGFSSRQQKKVCEFNGFYFAREGKGSHEIWSNSFGVQIVLPKTCKGATFASICREHKFVFVDSRGRKVY